jgi:hypothetical protein
MKFRASQLGKLMANDRSGKNMGQTAKGYIIQKAKQEFFEYEGELNSKYLNKGLAQEQDSINLLNLVRLEDYKKNEERVENEWLSGCCDIITDTSIIDIKTSWSLDTFPATNYELKDLSDYEWQGRAYMWLYDMPSFELCYVMVTTAPEIMGDYENGALHYVDHIAPEKRITSITFARDKEIEIQMAERLILATEFYNEVLTQLNNK